MYWSGRGKPQQQASLVIDPNGRIPYVSAECVDEVWRRRRRIYNDAVSASDAATRSAALSLDTSATIEQRQIEAWRRMSPAEKLQLVSDATQAVIDLSWAGIRRRHPGASDRECFLRFACIALGRDVARTVYPDLDLLTDTRP